MTISFYARWSTSGFNNRLFDFSNENEIDNIYFNLMGSS